MDDYADWRLNRQRHAVTSECVTRMGSIVKGRWRTFCALNLDQLGLIQKLCSSSLPST